MRLHRYRVFIKATPEQVWQGITDPEDRAVLDADLAVPFS